MQNRNNKSQLFVRIMAGALAGITVFTSVGVLISLIIQ